MKFVERAFVFQCAGDGLLGVVSVPEASESLGVLIVVGGPQYRVGSHRQFLALARRLAGEGYPAMRFDCRGMGDSSGALRSFELVSEDIKAAIDAFMIHCPQVRRVVLWGLCDAASASLIYRYQNPDIRLGGFCLLNPWVRSESTLARTQIKHYYGKRLMELEFWRKMLSGRLSIFGALKGFIASLLSARQAKLAGEGTAIRNFQEKMEQVLSDVDLPVLLILSGEDYTAKEFLEYAKSSATMSMALAHPKISRCDVPEANHTFSSAIWRAVVEEKTLAWLRHLKADV